MSLAIDTDKVVGVLLADGWHGVAAKSFDIDSYEFLYYHNPSDPSDFMMSHGGGQSGVCASGFMFTETYEGTSGGAKVYGPLTAILAVRTA